MSVDTKRLRRLLATVVKLEAVERATGDAVDMLDATYDDMTRDVEASRAATDARVALTRAVRADLPALLDELETARALLTEVLPSVDSGAVGHRWTGECDCAACRATALLSPDRAPAAFLES